MSWMRWGLSGLLAKCLPNLRIKIGDGLLKAFANDAEAFYEWPVLRPHWVSRSNLMFDNPAPWLLAALVAPCALLAVQYWQRALFAVFVLLVFEGALRKWAFPSAQAQLYLVKDGILLAAYLGFILDSRKKRPEPKGVRLIKIILIVGFVWGCIEVFNPNSPSILVGLVGVKSYFLYAPVAFILPYAIKSREHLFVLIRRYIIMAIPVAVLGFIQIAAGPESSLNVYVASSEDAPAVLAYFGDKEVFVRTSGTFSYISGYVVFLNFIAFLAIGYNMSHGWRLTNNITPILALALVVGAMFTTGSRGAIWILVAAGPVILWLAAKSRVLSPQIAMRLFMLVPVITILALSISPEATRAFMERAEQADTSYTLERLFQAPWETSGVLSAAPFLGVGIGATHNAALTIMGTVFPWWLGDLLTETEMARVTQELGPIGLLLTYFLRLLIAAFALRCAMRFKDPAYRALGIVLAIHLAQGVIGGIVLNVTAGLYYWGALGLVLAMCRLEQSAAEFETVPVRRADTTNLKPVLPNAGAVRRRPS
jgi:hypothetical protein